MRATKDCVVVLHAVAENLATAMSAHRGQGMNGAFERIKGVRIPGQADRERFVIIVAANFTLHDFSPSDDWEPGCLEIAIPEMATGKAKCGIARIILGQR